MTRVLSIGTTIVLLGPSRNVPIKGCELGLIVKSWHLLSNWYSCIRIGAIENCGLWMIKVWNNAQVRLSNIQLDRESAGSSITFTIEMI